jgi:hypothetical protein
MLRFGVFSLAMVASFVSVFAGESGDDGSFRCAIH